MVSFAQGCHRDAEARLLPEKRASWRDRWRGAILRRGGKPGVDMVVVGAGVYPPCATPMRRFRWKAMPVATASAAAHAMAMIGHGNDLPAGSRKVSWSAAAAPSAVAPGVWPA